MSTSFGAIFWGRCLNYTIMLQICDKGIDDEYIWTTVLMLWFLIGDKRRIKFTKNYSVQWEHEKLRAEARGYWCYLYNLFMSHYLKKNVKIIRGRFKNGK